MNTGFKPLIASAIERPLSKEEARRAFDLIMSGKASSAQISGFLIALRMRGETVEEITSAAAAMRAASLKVTLDQDAMDIVGTGGDGKGTLNISTATAFVVAGAGVPVAKHGNKNLSSLSGAADVLSMSDVSIALQGKEVETAMRDIGIAFMMAPVYHPAMKHVMPARVELGVRTVFNILGPLTNPAGVKRQITGAYDSALLRPMAEVLRELGTTKAWLMHGGDGTDELSISASSEVVTLSDGVIEETTVHPEDAGLPTHDFETIKGGTPSENAQAMKALLEGVHSPYRDAVLLNAAAALIVADHTDSLITGVEMARESIDSGAASQKLRALSEFSMKATS